MEITERKLPADPDGYFDRGFKRELARQIQLCSGNTDRSDKLIILLAAADTLVDSLVAEEA